MRKRQNLAIAVCMVPVLGAACGPVGTDGTSALGPPTGNPADAGTGAPLPGDGASVPDASNETPGADAPAGGSYTDQAAPGGYHVQGNTIYDAAGKPHLFHGVDRPSLEWDASGDHLSLADYQRMASWKANVVRIALNQDFWLQNTGAYEQTVDQQVHWAESAGLDVILDLHWSDRGDPANTPAQQRMADARSLLFWQAVAGKYQGDGHVLFELYNEPHDVPWGVWLGGGPSGDGFMVAGMQQLHDAVRATGAENLVIVGGLQFAYDLSGVSQYPVQGHNIVYATHPYNQPPNKQPGQWDFAFGTLSATYPVMATEFGDVSAACATDYDSKVIAYANTHNMSWSGWAWYPAGCQFPSLIADWSGTPTAAGQIEKSALQAY
jgi:hypothetical protein